MNVAERFVAKTCRGTNGCLRWTGAKNPKGYGRFNLNGVNELAHRAAWKLFVGPIPEGHEIDHVKTKGCEFRDCVEIDHLEPVTRRVNNQRKTPADQYPCGHPRTQENTKPRKGKDWAGDCRECDRQRHRKG